MKCSRGGDHHSIECVAGILGLRQLQKPSYEADLIRRLVDRLWALVKGGDGASQLREVSEVSLPYRAGSNHKHVLAVRRTLRHRRSEVIPAYLPGSKGDSRKRGCCWSQERTASSNSLSFSTIAAAQPIPATESNHVG